MIGLSCVKISGYAVVTQSGIVTAETLTRILQRASVCTPHGIYIRTHLPSPRLRKEALFDRRESLVA